MNRIKHIDYRKVFGEDNIPLDMLCDECGDIKLTDFNEKGDAILMCYNCHKEFE